jgi:hypothetical protein
MTPLLYRYLPREGSPSAEDRSRVFSWPKTMSIVVVDVESTLAAARLSDWKEATIRDIKRVPDAVLGLKTVAAKKIGVVFVTAGLADPISYRKARDWLQDRPSVAAGAFPDAPVLGRTSYGTSQTAVDALKEMIDPLKSQFSGKHQAVTANPDFARVYTEQGFATYWVGPTELVPPNTTATSWSELAEQME